MFLGLLHHSLFGLVHCKEHKVWIACSLQLCMRFLVKQLVLVLLGMGSNLRRGPRAHMLLDLVPIVAIELQS